MDILIVKLIGFYQVYISPYKGFRCAAGIYYGEGSCSKIVKSIVIEKGFRSGWHEICDQFRKCQHAATLIQSSADNNEPTEEECDEEKKNKDGKCTWWDLACMPCGTATEGAGTSAAGCAGAASSGCDGCACTPF